MSRIRIKYNIFSQWEKLGKWFIIKLLSFCEDLELSAEDMYHKELKETASIIKICVKIGMTLMCQLLMVPGEILPVSHTRSYWKN
jgi:hypothetical protein